MASAFGHSMAAVSIGSLVAWGVRPRPAYWLILCALAILPDIDVIGFSQGVRYGSIWGHRGFTHSILFALVTGGLGGWLLARYEPPGWKELLRWQLAAFLVVLSHGALDAMTTGGLGVGFLIPYSPHRYFFPWRPILVSPIGISEFFNERGWRVLINELQWIGIPSAVLFLVSRLKTWFRSDPQE